MHKINIMGQMFSETKKPVYINDWVEYSCVNGLKRYMRCVNPMGHSFSSAAEYMINNQAPKVGTTWKGGKVTVVKSHQTNKALWLVVFTECEPCYTCEWILKGTLADGTRVYQRDIDRKGGNFRDEINKMLQSEKTPQLHQYWKHGKVISKYCEHDGTCWSVRVMVK